MDPSKLAEYLTIGEAAEAVAMSTFTLRRAIRAGELKASIPRGRDPQQAGPGQGYRIHRDELARWFAGPK